MGGRCGGRGGGWLCEAGGWGGGGRRLVRWVRLISRSARNRARAQKQNKPVLFLPENQAKITRRKAQTPRGNHETPPTFKPRFRTPSTNRIEAHSAETCPGPENWRGFRGDSETETEDESCLLLLLPAVWGSFSRLDGRAGAAIGRNL